jgi:hypothetical protein
MPRQPKTPSSGQRLWGELKRLVRYYYDQGVTSTDDLMLITEINETWEAYQLSKDVMRAALKADLNHIIASWVDSFKKRETTAFKEQELFDTGFIGQQPETNKTRQILNDEIMQHPKLLILAIEHHLFREMIPDFKKKPFYPPDVYDRVDTFCHDLYDEMKNLYNDRAA